MTRKTAKKTASSRRPKTRRFKLTVEAQPMLVAYTTDTSGSPFAYGHFTSDSPHKPARRIPVSETGHWSHFAPMDEIAEADSPEAYARGLALAVINGKTRRQPSDREPTLFGLLEPA